MTTNGNESNAPGQTEASSTTMWRITIGIRFVAFLGLLGAGALNAMPEDRSNGGYPHYFQDRAQHVRTILRQPAWASSAALSGDEH